VRLLEPERVGGEHQELAHRPRRQQRVPALGMPEPGQVDRHQMRVFGELRPGWRKRQEALGPGTEQERVIAFLLGLGLGLGEADGEPSIVRNCISMGGCNHVLMA
jgi:hypothetical protein